MTEQLLNTIMAYCGTDKESSLKWVQKFRKSFRNIVHDEPWLTFIALYSLFGDQSDLTSQIRIDGINRLLQTAKIKSPEITAIVEIRMEKIFPEILEYRKYLRTTLSASPIHLYPDRRKITQEKLRKDNASFEGSTNVDIFIKAVSYDRELFFFIESKFLSDISYQTSYNPVRNQIIRNIDVGIDYAMISRVPLSSIYFLLLTPKVFRPKSFGGGKENGLNKYNPDFSRLYCYKMMSYQNPSEIRKDLPHRKNFTAEDSRIISKNIGWITFDDMIDIASNLNTLKSSERKHIENFFSERNLYGT